MGQRRQWHPTPVLLPGKSHGWRSLVGCSPWGCEESDMTERLHFHFSLSCIGEGNGNPLQCSCLENPRDGGAWWAAAYGVAQSQTWLTWLGSSSSSKAAWAVMNKRWFQLWVGLQSRKHWECKQLILRQYVQSFKGHRQNVLESMTRGNDQRGKHMWSILH